MRRITLISAALCAVLSTGVANAQDTADTETSAVAESEETEDADVTISGEAVFATSSVDSDFNELISDNPLAQLTLTAEFGNGMYAEAYAYVDITNPLNGESSEAGVEFGIQRTISGVTVTGAVGRYDNYLGQGIGEGDWIARLDAEYEGFSISATAFVGSSDTVAVRTAYRTQISERFSITPSVVWLTAYGSVNPGVSAEYALTEHVSARLAGVYPETDDGRQVFASFGIAFNF